MIYVSFPKFDLDFFMTINLHIFQNLPFFFPENGILDDCIGTRTCNHFNIHLIECSFTN